jgi:gas vesicle protein
MPTSPARTADDIADNIRSLIDRVVEAKFTQEMAKRGQDVAEVLAERGAEVGELATEAWRDSKPMRRDAAKRVAKASGEAAKWSDQTWRKSLRPFMKDLWKQRTVAIGAAGAAVPVGRELVDTAAERLGIRQRREERHWGAFFLGLLVGAAAGAIVALLTAPKRGDEMRRELTEKADEIATKARDEWVPIFQGGETNGHSTAATDAVSDAGDALHDAAAEAGTASGEAAEQAADDTAEAINESFDAVDRESPTV